MDNKKKLVLGALFVAIFGIGAFQFVGGSSEEPAQAAKSSAKQDVPKTADRPVASVYPPLAARDPFKTERLPGGVVQAAPKEQEQPAGGTQKAPPSEFSSEQWGPLPGPDPNGADGAAQPLQAEPEFKYVLVGVVEGETPAAVFADSAGNQRLITLGGAIDGDSKLLSISRGKVTVKFNKQTLTLTIGGTASAK